MASKALCPFLGFPITGWKSFPILLFDKKGNGITGLNGFTVSGRGREMDFLLPPDQIPFGENRSYVHWIKEHWKKK